MTCPPAPPTFRLLDAYVGWDEHDVCRLTGLEDPGGGIRLAFADGAPGGLRRHELLPWFPDRRLAPGCGPCAWYLAGRHRGLLRREPCGDGFQPVWPPDCDPGLVQAPLAVAAARPCPGRGRRRPGAGLAPGGRAARRRDRRRGGRAGVHLLARAAGGADGGRDRPAPLRPCRRAPRAGSPPA